MIGMRLDARASAFGPGIGKGLCSALTCIGAFNIGVRVVGPICRTE